MEAISYVLTSEDLLIVHEKPMKTIRLQKIS